jgi:hypothetical protein
LFRSHVWFLTCDLSSRAADRAGRNWLGESRDLEEMNKDKSYYDNLKDAHVLKTVAEEHSIKLSKPMIRILGLDSALMFCEIISLHNLDLLKRKGWDRNGEIWTHCGVAKVTRETGLNSRRQLKAIKKLADYGLISKNVYGYPKQRDIMINVDCLEKLQNDMKKDNEDWSKLQEKMRVRHEEIVQAADYDKDLWFAGLRSTTGLRVEE